MNCVVKKSTSNDIKIINKLYTLEPFLSNAERRKQIRDYSDLYEQLNLIQKVMVCELGRLGYQLHFIRGKYANSIAILICNEQVATVDRQGEVALNTDIKIRK